MQFGVETKTEVFVSNRNENLSFRLESKRKLKFSVEKHTQPPLPYPDLLELLEPIDKEKP